MTNSRFCLLAGRVARRPLTLRQLYNRTATLSTKTDVTRIPNPDEQIPEQEIPIVSFGQKELVPEKPLTSLQLYERIEKIEKKGSFCVDLFTGKFDNEFLIYPEPVFSRAQSQTLERQGMMVKQLWPQIWDDRAQLQKFNFFNMYQMSVTEMMTIFESIGESSDRCFESELHDSKELMQSHMQPFQRQALVSKAIIGLITRNCLTYWPIHNSSNEKLKSLIPQKPLEYGGASELTDPILPMGFCWTEQAPNLGSLPPQEWQTFGKMGGNLVGHHLITGKKSRILINDETENYLVFYRDSFLSEEYKDSVGKEPNPSADPFMGCSIVNKADLKFGPLFIDSAGMKYCDVEIDATLSNDNILFPGERLNTAGINIKALGQTASCAVVLGLLKNSLSQTYKYLLDHKIGLINCDIIERKLAEVTSKIFAIESTVYYIAGMYDGLKPGFDAHLEATILKIITTEFAYEIIRDLQQINASNMFITSKIQDQINIFDSFLDGNIYNRLYVATMGIIWFARSKNIHLNQLRLAPWYPGYFFKSIMKEKLEKTDFLTIDADIYGQLHPSMSQAAETIEYVAKRIKYAAERLCMTHGADVTAAQSNLYRLAQLCIDCFTLTTVCARASKSYCNGNRNSEMDVTIATNLAGGVDRRSREFISQIHLSQSTMLDNRAKTINELNMKLGGYYASTPLDPNV